MTMDSIQVPFPWKLHRLLDDAEKASGGFHDVVSWVLGGLAFKVHDKNRFSQEILSRYFHTNKYNKGGFESIDDVLG